jgi:hypothetical protein
VARQANRHLKWLLGIGGAGLLLTAGTNLAVNPWRVLPEATEVSSLDPFREIDAENFTCKAGLSIRGPWDTLIVGTSRPNNGINPLGPALQDKAAVNLGVPGSDVIESAAMLRYALQHQSPKHVLFFVDQGDLTNPGLKKPESDFAISPLASGEYLERNLRYLFSQLSIDAAAATLKSAKTGKTPNHTTRGMRIRGPAGDDFFLTMEKHYLPWVLLRVDDQNAGRGLIDKKLAAVRDMLAACAEKGIGPVLAIPPNHMSICQAMEESGAPDPYYLDERRALAELVAEFNRHHPVHPCQLWDLNIPSPITLEPFPARDSGEHMAFWLDPIHFSPAAGERYVTFLLSPDREDAALGIRVDVTQPEAYVDRVRSLFEEAKTALPDEREGIRRTLAEDAARQPH